MGSSPILGTKASRSITVKLEPEMGPLAAMLAAISIRLRITRQHAGNESDHDETERHEADHAPGLARELGPTRRLSPAKRQPAPMRWWSMHPEQSG